jgi:hypothetical protein
MPDELKQNDDLPASLRSDLAELFARSAPVPEKIDGAVLAEFHRRASHIRRLRWTLRWSGVAAAVAAVAIICWNLWPASKPMYRPGATVTILDAYSLARQLKANTHPDKSCDVNHDGIVDQKDVDQIAGQAVSLKGRAQ